MLGPSLLQRCIPNKWKFALILSGRTLDSITYQKPREKRPLTAKDCESTCACAHVTNPFSSMGLPGTELLFHGIERISFISKFWGVGKSAQLRLRRSASGVALLRASCVAFGLREETSPALVSMAQLLGEGRHWFLGGRSFWFPFLALGLSKRDVHHPEPSMCQFLSQFCYPQILSLLSINTDF